MVNRSLIKDRIRGHEGLRLTPYRCPAGALTIGYGRNLDAKGISLDEAELMLQNDIMDAENELYDVFPWMHTIMDEERYGVMIEMVFNLGINGFCSFKKMIQAVKEHDFMRAAAEMLDSQWAGQVGERALRLAKIMRGV